MLYGDLVTISRCMSDGSVRAATDRTRNGIWSNPVFSHVDAVFWHREDSDLLGQVWTPRVFVNPHKAEKLRSVPEPFASMVVEDSGT